MENKKLWTIIRFIAFMFIFGVLFNYITYVMRDKTCAEEYYPFFSEEEDFDVYVIGPSTARGGISPLDLWHEYGIGCYNLAMSGQTLPMNYYLLENAIEKDMPEVVLVDLCYLFFSTAGAEARLHQMVDNMPWGRVKIDAVLNLTEKANYLDYLLNLFYYHDRWKELGKKDFDIPESYNFGSTLAAYSLKDGVLLDTRIAFSEKLDVIPEEVGVDTWPAINEQYILKMIELCKSKDIAIIFFVLPSYATGETSHGDGEELQMMWNGFAGLAMEQEVPYINFMHKIDELEFDFTKDMTDWTHLGITGSEKVSSYLGKFLLENYDLPDRREDVEYSDWDEAYQNLCRRKESMLKKREELWAE